MKHEGEWIIYGVGGPSDGRNMNMWLIGEIVINCQTG